MLDDDPARVFGFDTGPANAPLDRLARRLSGGALACDRDGQFARAGRVDESLLAELLEDDPFLVAPPAEVDRVRDVRRRVRRPRRRASRRPRRRPDGHAHRVRRPDGRRRHPPVRRARPARRGGRRGRRRREEPGPDGADRRAGRADPGPPVGRARRAVRRPRGHGLRRPGRHDPPRLARLLPPVTGADAAQAAGQAVVPLRSSAQPVVRSILTGRFARHPASRAGCGSDQ